MLKNYKNSKILFSRLASIINWIVLSVIVGVCGGLIGTLFSKSVTFVTQLREEYGWLLYILPLGGLATVAIYKLLKVNGVSTNRVFESVRSEKNVPLLLTPAVFLCSVITHLFGGSAGREGAALQIGGSIASLICRLFKPDEDSRHTLIQCGMSAVFSALFGTPLGAAVFSLEVIRVGYIRLAAIMPCVISSVIAFAVSTFLGVESEKFNLTVVPDLSISVLLKITLISVCGALLSNLFCRALHYSEHYFKKFINNDFLRIFIGGILVVIISVLLGTSDYNGGGMHVIERIFIDGQVKPEAFVLKFILTVITVAAGYKGGEIVPSFFIGATFGAVMAGLLGLPPALGAAVGMSSMFCGVTNCPLASVFISIELFGAQGSVYFALSCALSFLLSGYAGLYEGQKIMFSKFDESFIDKNAE